MGNSQFTIIYKMPIPVIAIFDIGKTNKKIFLFNEQYQIVYERSVQFAETTDEDGDACEDLKLLTDWVHSTLKEVMMLNSFNIKALNFSTYGASFVHLDTTGTPVTPLYNYLKSFPEKLSKQFYFYHPGLRFTNVKILLSLSLTCHRDSRVW